MKYFEHGRLSPYMIMIDRTRKAYQNELKNVTHVNGTARTQTVDDASDPKFYYLLKAFYKESGIAVLLNTSLNRKGMPIVETPAEAIELFNQTALDVLVMENTVVEKKYAPV